MLYAFACVWLLPCLTIVKFVRFFFFFPPPFFFFPTDVSCTPIGFCEINSSICSSFSRTLSEVEQLLLQNRRCRQRTHQVSLTRILVPIVPAMSNADAEIEVSSAENLVLSRVLSGVGWCRLEDSVAFFACWHIYLSTFCL